VGKDRYEGGFRDGHITGYGIYTKADGRRYEGEFVDGKMNGRAKVYIPNGDILEGQFAENKLLGLGKLTRKTTGEVIDVELRDGKLARATSPTPTAIAPASGSGSQASDTVKWVPRLDLDDLFPSYILATATRKDPPALTPQFPRGDPLSIVANILQGAAGTQAVPEAIPMGVRYLGDRWGQVGVQVRTTEPYQEVVVGVEVDEVAEPTSVRFKLDAPGDYLLYPKLRYKYDKLRAVTQPIPVNTWKVTVNGKPLGSQMRTATLRSVYDAPIQARTARGAENMSWVFAAYVTEDAPWIDKLLQETLQRRYVRQFIGYQGSTQDVTRQVEAIYNELHRRGIRYSSITTSSNASSKVVSQVVRFPSDSIANSQANCIDGTVLMASILRKIGLDAFIILGPSQAKPCDVGLLNDWEPAARNHGCRDHDAWRLPLRRRCPPRRHEVCSLAGQPPTRSAVQSYQGRRCTSAGRGRFHGDDALMPAVETPVADYQPFRVLCLDGGSMRGVCQATYLATYAHRLAKSKGAATTALDIGSAFDLNVGTRTGGIVVSALAKGIPLQDVQELYTMYGGKIFPYQWLRCRPIIGNYFIQNFGIGLRKGEAALRKALTSKFGTTTIADVTFGASRGRMAVALGGASSDYDALVHEQPTVTTIRRGPL